MMSVLLVIISFISVGLCISPTGFATRVSYDERAFLINGTRELLLSGCVHYPRSTPSTWPSILALTKQAGIDVIQTYVFWNLHQPTGPNDWYFEDRADVWTFLQRCQEAGLFVNLRIGPYVCAEWNLGGIPVWVKDIPNIVFRDYDQPWIDAMGTFVTRFVQEGLKRNIFAHQGGPVILAQIENEYGNVEGSFSQPAKYVQWAVNLAENLTNHEPWIMCAQDNAPNVPNLVNTCNGFYCDSWLSGHFSSRKTPAAWTENWPGWFQNWGSSKPHRPVQDVAFAVARWVARGGAHMNYYMWHGGTTWDRLTGGPMLVTSYDYDVALDEYGLPHNPKYSHSAQLHFALKNYSQVIVKNPVDPGTTIANNVFVNVYGSGADCVAFLSNIDAAADATVTWKGNQYHVPAWSVSILGGCGATVTFNTAQVKASPSTVEWISVEAISNWSWWSDSVGIWDSATSITANAPLEQVKTTHDKTDYFWYHVTLSEPTPAERTLKTQANDIAYFFINGVHQGTARSGNPAQVRLSLPSGSYSLDILTQTVGLTNYGAHYEDITRGIAGGNVYLDTKDITRPSGGWVHQVGLKGESLQIWNKPNAVNWNTNAQQGMNKPLTWWRAQFPTPAGSTPLALDMTGLGKGFAYVNGHGLGRYWNITAGGNCPSCANIDSSCNYRGNYSPGKCSCDCGVPSQRYYHVPRDWLAAAGGSNDLILIEEVGAADLGTVNLVTRQ